MNNSANSVTINLGGSPDETPSFEVNGVRVIIPGPWQVKSAVAILLLILSLYSFIWITEDAQKRGKSGCLAFLFVCAAGWPFSLLWWLWLRPRLPNSTSSMRTPSPAPPSPPTPLPPEVR